MLLKYHRKISGCGISGRRCTAPWIAYIATIYVDSMPQSDTSIHFARDALEHDASPQQSPYQQSRILALLQKSQPKQEALQYTIQHLQWWTDTSTVQEYTQLSTYSGYQDSSPSREALYVSIVVYALSTWWTQCNKPYELLAGQIEMMSPEMLLHWMEYNLHSWNNCNANQDRHSQWSWYITWNTK
jgi:hypothetical protein